MPIHYVDTGKIFFAYSKRCSDHVSWTQLGYASAFVFESEFKDHSPYIHTSGDDISHISFEHMSEFVKLVIGWGVELTA